MKGLAAAANAPSSPFLPLQPAAAVREAWARSPPARSPVPPSTSHPPHKLVWFGGRNYPHPSMLLAGWVLATSSPEAVTGALAWRGAKRLLGVY